MRPRILILIVAVVAALLFATTADAQVFKKALDIDVAVAVTPPTPAPPAAEMSSQALRQNARVTTRRLNLRERFRARVKANRQTRKALKEMRVNVAETVIPGAAATCSKCPQ